MINPAVIGAIVALASASRRASGSASQPDPLSPHIVLVLVILFMLLPISLAVAYEYPFLGWPAVLALIVLLVPWWFTRWCLIPLGLADAARFLTVNVGSAWEGDRYGGSIAAGVWAQLRRRSSDTGWIDRQEKHFKKSSLRAGGILAHGLSAAARGDLDAARLILDSVGDLHDVFSPPLARKLAREWLMLDALERGDWYGVFARGDRPGPRTIASRFLYGVAAIRCGQPYGFAFIKLPTWWIFSWHWRALWPMWQQAVRHEAPRTVTAVPDTLPAVLALHARLLTEPPGTITMERLIALSKAWDLVLRDPQWTGQPAHASEAVRADVRAKVVDDLATMLADVELPLADRTDHGGVLGEVASVIRNQRLSHLEQLGAFLQRRVKEEKALSPFDEWREFLQVRQAYKKVVALGGTGIHGLAFGQVYHAVSSLAIWFYNKRDERPLGHAIFQWMLTAAIAAGDTEAIRLQTKNTGLIPKTLRAPQKDWF